MRITDFLQPPRSLARALLGARLVRVLPDGTRLAGTIVETEAYLGVRDRAAHSFGGRRTERNEAMYARAGTAYVYFTYGMHHCLDIVCGKLDEPVAVLIRALEPTEGIEAMHAIVKRDHRAGDLPTAKLCAGPARLCRALAIDRALDGIDLPSDPRLFVERGGLAGEAKIVTGPRIGVDYAKEWAPRPLRYWLLGHPSVSKPGPGKAQGVKRQSGKRSGADK